MEPRTFYIRTFGCQMNEHDSLKMAALLKGQGYEATGDSQQAGVILFNTCTVRQKAHDKAFSEIGRAVTVKGTFPLQGKRPLIGVCGCVAQEEGAKLLTRFPKIDLIFGPDQIYQLPTLLDLVVTQRKPAIATELINSAEDYHFIDALETFKLQGPKAYVTIMKGCNSHCSYCIVPQVRGREVYRPAREIIREIELLVEKGCKEVILLGQNVNSYGMNTPDAIGSDAISFGKLIRLIAENTDIARIRFTSPHPKDVRDDLVQEYETNPKLCSHIHLPLQSGSDSVLRRMRRAYNTKTYLEKVLRLRSARYDIAITTDMIVGFPGETDSEFEQTMDFIEQVKFDGMFAFKYSPRPGTEATQRSDDIALEIKETRLQQLFQLQETISAQHNHSYLDQVVSVLVEGKDKRNLRKWQGRTSQNQPVNFASQEGLIGAIVNVRVTKATAYSLEGEVIGDDQRTH